MSNPYYTEVSARVMFEDGYLFESYRHLPFEIKPIIKDVISLEKSMCNNALLKVELTLWEDDNIIKILDVTSDYLGGTID